VKSKLELGLGVERRGGESVNPGVMPQKDIMDVGVNVIMDVVLGSKPPRLV
jgi:hypothetical protein